MDSSLIIKLEHGCVLSSEDRRRLNEITKATRVVRAGRDIISEGDSPSDVHLVMEGVACRYKMLSGGHRHIMALLLPGDFCDLHVAILGAMDHCIGTITDCRMVEIPRADIEDLTLNFPRITRALWWATLVDEAILREWLVNMGGRLAEEKLAHLFCEMYVRMQTTGRVDGEGTFVMPLTQQDLADTLGLSTVHVNRSLQKLRRGGLIHLRSQRLTVPSFATLRQFAGFNPNYLHRQNALVA